MQFNRLSNYSTDQKKPNRERLRERVLFPFHTHSRSRSASVLYPFCIRSVSVLYPFCIRSVSVPFPFCICSMLFCSSSVRVQSVSVLGTRSGERGFWEIVSRISDTHLHLTKWLKLSRYTRIRTINLNFRGENMSPVFWKNREDGIVLNFKVSLEKCFTKRPVVCGKEVNQLAKHF